MTPTTTLLTDCIRAFTEARGKIADAMESLWKVHEAKAWEGEYESWTDFCEEGLKISHSTASQYVQIYDRYVNQGRLTVNQIRQVDPVKLYKALKLVGTPEQQYSTALTWRREDFKDDLKENGHTHEFFMYCKHCWRMKP